MRLLIAGLLLGFSLWVAPGKQLSHADSAKSSFWRLPPSEAAPTPFAERFQALHDLSLLAFEPRRGNLEKREIVNRCLRTSELLLQDFPKEVDLHLLVVHLLRQFYLGKKIVHPKDLKKAISHIDSIESLDPLHPDLGNLYSVRAISLTKLYGETNLKKAMVDYSKQLELLDQSNPAMSRALSQTLSNQAEVFMMLGRLREAIAGYEASLQLDQNIVHGYGLAVALDRDGQRERARSLMGSYARRDSNNILENDDTYFFVPKAEGSYYLALRAEVLGQRAEAANFYRHFLAKIPHSRYAARARENLASLTQKSGKPK